MAEFGAICWRWLRSPERARHLTDRYELVFNNFYRVERCGAAALADGGGPFGLDILLALLFDDLVRAYESDSIVECVSSFGDTTVYLAHRYPGIPVVSCDIDPLCAAIASQRTAENRHVKVRTGPSPRDHQANIRAICPPDLFSRYPWRGTWPILDELSLIKTGVVVIHDFDTGHAELARGSRTLLRGDIIPEEVSDGKACSA